MNATQKKIAKDYIKHCLKNGLFLQAESFVLGLFIAGGISQRQNEAVLKCINKAKEAIK